MTKIITEYVHPPIPDRGSDWRAYHEGDEEKPTRHGWGATEAEALADLARLDREYAEAMEDEDERKDR
jgi:hypothetical protein